MSLLKILNKVRRKLMLVIDKNYVKKKLAKRKGKCKRCGQCCLNCECLDKETKLCKVYDNRPDLCHKDFPIDEFDKRVFNVEGKCGFEFD